ncbi:hypothetical protein MT325_m147R [Paramecium bursaria chlorella virus MT325]|uniref:Uncharacterized protein m147R n=1 Tax=Paramecium bursaria Chlorella virus MT325 TaxID=346932 RepID=A7ITM7_PBCVM|nr:hypothetical protein MT325_m147R [Paramecium bursaria chlorella virus MT325]
MPSFNLLMSCGVTFAAYTFPLTPPPMRFPYFETTNVRSSLVVFVLRANSSPGIGRFTLGLRRPCGKE